ncbi:MAG: hypothetical protein WAN76_16685 [Candidatus Sulfotelmatobacter sp.]
MKKRVIAVLFGLSLLAFVGEVQAQTTTFKVQVPFPFVVGNQTLPAGTYQIQRLLGRPREADEIGIIVVRSSAPRLYKAVVTDLVRLPLDSNSSSQLVFANRGGQHYLAEVHVQGEKNHQIPNVSRELELARSNVSQEEVVLAELR